MATNAGEALRDTDSREDINAALRTFFRIADVWGLSADDQIKLLGSPPRSTYFKLKKEGGNLSMDTGERLSYILGIYKALMILLPTAEAAHSWLRRPNDAPMFNGKSALDRMLGGQVADLYMVRRYLDAQRGG
jgi:uncharacterized protein (DUF2384 family)